MHNLFLVWFVLSCIISLLPLAYLIWIFLKAIFIKSSLNALDKFMQPVSIIIAAYNEEDFIRDKLLFFLGKNEWIPGSEIIVVSSGSIDGTNTILPV